MQERKEWRNRKQVRTKCQIGKGGTSFFFFFQKKKNKRGKFEGSYVASRSRRVETARLRDQLFEFCHRHSSHCHAPRAVSGFLDLSAVGTVHWRRRRKRRPLPFFKHAASPSTDRGCRQAEKHNNEKNRAFSFTCSPPPSPPLPSPFSLGVIVSL